MSVQISSTGEEDIFLYHRNKSIFLSSKKRMTIVRNEIYFCTSGNTNKIVLAFRQRLLKVWQVSRTTPRQKPISSVYYYVYLYSSLQNNFFVRQKVVSSSQAPRQLLFDGQKNYFETPRTNIRSSIPPHTVFSSSELFCFAK